MSGLREKYLEIKALSGARPTRTMMYLKLGQGFNEYRRKGWLKYLAGMGELDQAEKSFLGTAADDFLTGLEDTKFDKAYKIPVVLTFLTEGGEMRPAVHLKEIAGSMMEFYQRVEEHQLDFHDKSNREWRRWGIEDFAALALKNPITFLSRSMERFFVYQEDDQMFALRNLDGYLNSTLAFHIRDIMEYRRLKYFRGHYKVDPNDLAEVAEGRVAEGPEGYASAGEESNEQVKVYHKLIRDRIPEIIEEQGKRCVLRTLGEDEYRVALDRKLQEELAEYLDAGTVEELADLVEVALAIVKVKGLTEEEFERVRMGKKEKRGGFEKRLLLEKVEG